MPSFSRRDWSDGPLVAMAMSGLLLGAAPIAVKVERRVVHPGFPRLDRGMLVLEIHGCAEEWRELVPVRSPGPAAADAIHDGQQVPGNAGLPQVERHLHLDGQEIRIVFAPD